MLIYTALKAEELFNAERSFIIFKEFSQEEREDYTGLAHVTQYNQGEIVQCLDYEYVWWWVFHNNIAETLLSTIKRQYSRDCWSEITEELSLSYTLNELELIKEWLTGMPWQTTYAIMYEKAIKLWAGSHENLLARFDELMRDLYKSGIIGNYRRSYFPNPPTHRWYFRGDETLLKNQDIQIHRIFSTVLSTVRPE